MKRLSAIIDSSFDSRYSIYIILGLGVLLRLIGLYLVSGLVLTNDGFGYHKIGLQLLQNINFHPHRPPGLSYYLSFFYYLFGESELVARACMILLYLMLSVFLFLLSKELSNRKIANIVVLIFSVYPTYIYNSITPLTQMLMASVLIAIAYFAIRLRKNMSWICSILLGLLLGAGVLVRPSSAILVLFLPLYFVVTKRRFLLPSIMLTSAIVLISLWIFKVYKMTGEFVMINSANSMNFFFGNNQWTPMYRTWWFGSHLVENDEYNAFVKEIRKNPPYVQEKLYKQSAINHILSRPDLFLLRTLNRFRVYFAFEINPGAILIKGHNIDKKIGLGLIMLNAAFYLSIASLAILFLFLPFPISGNRGAINILIGIIILYSMPYWIAFSHPSYHLPIVPIMGIFAVISGTRLLNEPGVVWKYVVSSKRRKYFALFAMIFFVYIQIEWIVMMYSYI